MTTAQKKWKLAVQNYAACLLIDNLPSLRKDNQGLWKEVIEYGKRKSWDKAMYLRYDRLIKEAEEMIVATPHLKQTYVRKIAQYKRQLKRYSRLTRFDEKLQFQMEDAGILQQVHQIINLVNQEEAV